MGNQRLLGVLLASFSLLQASQVEALALGRLQVMSAQQEPMLVELSLTETEGVIAAAVEPRLASRGEYQVAGIDYQDWFDAIQLQVIERNNQLLVQITSPDAVSEEALGLLVEVDYMGGRLLGQYRPEFAEEATKNIAKTETAAVEMNVVEQATIEAVPIVAGTAEPSEPAPVSSNKIEIITKSEIITQDVIVKSGQTLWRVATDNAPQGISPWQSLMAIYKANPKAFKNGRITQIMANSKITIPTIDAMKALSAKQAKAAYEQIVASYKIKPKAVAKPAPNPAPAPLKQVQPTVEQDQQLQAMNSTLSKLENQSQALQQQLRDLETARTQAEQETQALQAKNQQLALGLQTQEASLQTLTENKQVLEQDLTSLGQQVGETELELQDKQQQLSEIGEEVNALQQTKQYIVVPTPVLTPAPVAMQVQTSAVAETAIKSEVTAEGEEGASAINISKQLYPWLMGGLVVLMLGLVFSMLWRWVNRKVDPVAQSQEPLLGDTAPPVVLDPLADYDVKPSTQSQNLRQTSERMELNEQVAVTEAGFIEQLLQEQSNQTGPQAEDTLHLSAEVEAMLQQQRTGSETSHEPTQMGSNEEDIDSKLDLARSYKKMGHIDEAQALLQQVLHGGNLEQQTEATLLLSRMRQD